MSDEFSQSIAIVWPADVPAGDPEAHCTMLYLGQIDDPERFPFSQEDVEDVLADWIMPAPGWHPIKGTALYGANKDVLVAELIDHKLTLAEQRHHIELSLALRNIPQASSFPFSPHVTIKEQYRQEEAVPGVTLYEPVLWWGADRPTGAVWLADSAQSV